MRRKYGRAKDYIVYQCMIADCPHYIPKEQAVGKVSICWYCGKEFTIKIIDLLRKPHCGCKRKATQLNPEMLDIMARLGLSEEADAED